MVSNSSSLMETTSLNMTTVGENFTSKGTTTHSPSSGITEHNVTLTHLEPYTESKYVSTSNANRKKKSVKDLWKKINLLGCVTVLNDLYGKTLIHGHGFLAIEIGLCVFILVEITALALAFAYALNTSNNIDYDMTDDDDY